MSQTESFKAKVSLVAAHQFMNEYLCNQCRMFVALRSGASAPLQAKVKGVNAPPGGKIESSRDPTDIHRDS